MYVYIYIYIWYSFRFVYVRLDLVFMYVYIMKDTMYIMLDILYERYILGAKSSKKKSSGAAGSNDYADEHFEFN